VIELRPTREEDLAELGRLLHRRFGHSIPAQEWGWKYRQIPGEARSVVAATPEGEILAHAGALCLPARWAGGDGGIWQLVDFAGSTSRGGLRPPLIELGRLLLADLPRSHDLPWIFGFPSARHFRLGERVFGYQPVGWIEELEGELPTASPPGEVEIATGDSCSPWQDTGAPEAIWARAAGAGVRRSAAFLNWRYHARPERYYRFYRLTADGAEGLAVFAFVGAEAWAAELWLPAEAGWYPSMLAVAADLAAAGIRRWRFWAPDAGRQPELSRLFGALGLAATGGGVFLGCRGAAGSPAQPAPVSAAGGFIHAMGDYDLV
jgi:hypothetical protein